MRLTDYAFRLVNPNVVWVKDKRRIHCVFEFQWLSLAAQELAMRSQAGRQTKRI